MAEMTSETLGKYEIRSVLGKGAMGTVYAAWDPIISRRVAIKTVRLPDASDIDAQEELARFKREAQAAGRLTHPNIVGVYDYGETDTVAYIVMEFVDGRTLKQILDGNQRLPIGAVAKVMADLLCGLQFSHARGVVHRDIKPANLMIVSGEAEDGLGQAKIADFGIARIESSNLTQAGTIMGTPAYMSPEQFMGQTVDARTDIYSSGVLLFQMLTGERPFEGSMASIMHKALNTEPPRPSDLSVNVPRALDGVVARAMARRPEDRFATADEFAGALRAALEGKAAPPIEEADATVVHSATRPGATRPGATRPPGARPGAAPAAAAAREAPAARRSRAPLLAGVAVVALAALGAGGWYLMQPGPTPPGPVDASRTGGAGSQTPPTGSPGTTQAGNLPAGPTRVENDRPTPTGSPPASTQAGSPPAGTTGSQPGTVQAGNDRPTGPTLAGNQEPQAGSRSPTTQAGSSSPGPTSTITAQGTPPPVSPPTSTPTSTPTSGRTGTTGATTPGERRATGNLPRLDPAVTSTPQVAVTTAPTVAGSSSEPTPVQTAEPGPVVTRPSGPTVAATSTTPPLVGAGASPPVVVPTGGTAPTVAGSGGSLPVANSTSPPPPVPVGTSTPAGTVGGTSPQTVGGTTPPLVGGTTPPGPVPVVTNLPPSGPSAEETPAVTGPGTNPAANSGNPPEPAGGPSPPPTSTGSSQVAAGTAPEALRDAVATAVRSTSCSVLHGTLEPNGSLSVAGTIVAGPPVQTALRDLHEVVPAGRLRWSVSEAIGPFCPVLDTVRGFAAPLAGGGRALAILPKTGRPEWLDGEVMSATVEAPAFPSYLQLDYFTRDDKGERFVLHAVSSAGAAPMLAAGERQAFPLGKAGSPFGTDVLVAIASSAPLFGAKLPEIERQADYLPRLQTALDAARARDTQISADTSVVRTRKR